MYARHRRLCRRMYGYIYLVEADSPRSMVNYLAAWERLGLSGDERVTKFYELHITADEGHQDVALNEVIAPVVAAEPAAAPDVARGVLEGHAVHHLFSTHLHSCFAAGRSALRAP
jgi:pyrroloquinoline quinone (PQQ) biosynthesis protein C